MLESAEDVTALPGMCGCSVEAAVGGLGPAELQIVIVRVTPVTESSYSAVLAVTELIQPLALEHVIPGPRCGKSIIEQLSCCVRARLMVSPLSVHRVPA
jgi:hypothetical protein